MNHLLQFVTEGFDQRKAILMQEIDDLKSDVSEKKDQLFRQEQVTEGLYR